ncbi:MAG TPA: TetR/AcrR family transcriptional regulator [Acidimicrobiales bacterium]|jgi:AcrR family transcriptional regulator|nr:TetR/AcrR family transcriptional regulator [Acidimicrobiales bacterium]
MVRKGEHGDDRTAIIGAAWIVLERAGFEGFKIQLVLRETGLSARSFYQHFTDKDELLLALMEDEYARSAARLRRVVREADGAPEKVAAWIAELVAAAEDPRRVQRARLFSSQQRVMRRFPEAVASASRLLVEPLERALRDGAETGEFSTAEPERDAEIILRLTGATMNDALIDWTDQSVAELVASSVDFALRALGKTSGNGERSEA